MTAHSKDYKRSLLIIWNLTVTCIKWALSLLNKTRMHSLKTNEILLLSKYREKITRRSVISLDVMKNRPK